MEPTKYKLTYFNYRGRAEPIRLLFAYKGIEYIDERLEQEDWLAIKSSKPWGSVPVLEVTPTGGNEGQQQAVVFGESSSALRYLGAKYGLVGSTDWERAKCDEYIESMKDLAAASTKAFTPDQQLDPDKKQELQTKFLTETYPFYLQQWNEILETNGTAGYLVGSTWSIADFYVGSFLQGFTAAFGQLEQYPALNRHQRMVFAAAGIREWIEKRPKTQF